ncbi:MAG TPA: hypothetical protein PLH23_01120 [Hyphomonadaceae bacterium]|jgi:hypothetical protein|nr:hypothetical protein [Hyphomonadaceae bacterium]HPI46838.1 hypothetical protein [Hyphomonadaceae bacterium]
MRDRLFFPLAFVLASSFIMMALNPFSERVPSGPVSAGAGNAEDVTVQGAELHRFVPGNYDSISFVAATGDVPPALRITRQATEEYQDPRSGPHLVFAEDVEFAMEHRRIQIDIEARAAGEFAASQFEANYFAKTEYETGWKPFDLTPEFQTYRFIFETPPRGETVGYDFLGIRPVAPDKQRTMEVRSVRVHALTGKKK